MKLIGTEGVRLLWDQRDRRDPAGAIATRRLTARPKESEQPGVPINLTHSKIATTVMGPILRCNRKILIKLYSNNN
jgi:hypothetical protein